VNARTGWASGNGDIYKTTNFGGAWMRELVPGHGQYDYSSVSFVHVDDGSADGKDYGWACGSWVVNGAVNACRIIRTTNGGVDWDVVKQWTSTTVSGSVHKDDVQLLRQVDFVDEDHGWATGWGKDATGSWGYVVLRTTNGGDDWSITRFADGNATISAMDFATESDGWLATGTIDGYVPATIWKTADGGATWAVAETREGSTVSDLSAMPSGECYASGQAQGSADWRGFILHTVDAGATWTEEWAEFGLKPNAVAFSATGAVAVGDGALRLSRTAATPAWAEYIPGVRKNLTNVQFWDTSLGWAVGWRSTILRTTDGGKKWTAASVPSGISLEGIDMVSKKIGWAVGCSGPHVPYIDMDAGYGAVVLKTTDGGLTWKFQLNRTTKPGLAGVDFTDSKHGVAVGTAGLVARTQDGGKTWWLRTVGSQTLRDVRFLDSAGGVAVGGDSGSVSGNGSVWRTADGGATWTKATLPQDEQHAAPIRAVFKPLETVAGSGLTAVGDRSQIYTSTDGISWAFENMTPGLIYQDPPFPHGMDIGMTGLADPAIVSYSDPIGWVLGDDGQVWTKPANWTPEVPWVLSLPASSSHLLDHTGGSGQDNQLKGLAVVDWINAWAVGDRGTVLSFDRMAPKTTVAPSNGWVNSPQVTLSASDGKSGVSAVRWIVDPPGINGDVQPPITGWETWTWNWGSTVTWDGERQDGDSPGSRHVIYYQAFDNVGNEELDPFWLRYMYPIEPNLRYAYEVPKHIWVTLDTVGPQTYAPWAVTVKRNAKPAFDFWVNDDLSDKASVTILVKNGGGDTVKKLSLGWLATSHEFSSPISDWKCTLAKGSYTFDVLAADQAGNPQQIKGSNTFTVK
jgi:photosystem II stability/assembly factor-like uncharacterized protein